MAVEVDDEDGARARGGAARDLSGVEAVRARIDVAEHWHCARGDRCRHGWHPCIGWYQHLVAGLDAQCSQRDRDRVGARADTDGAHVVRVVGGEAALELLELGPHQKAAAVQHARDRGVELGADRVHARLELIERHTPLCRRARRHAGVATAAVAQ